MKKVTVILTIASLVAACGALAQPETDDAKSLGTRKMTDTSSVKMTSHETIAIVKKIDAKTVAIVLADEPVKSLDWPAMTMGFKVKDKLLFNKLAVDKKVEGEFVQDGKDYVVTTVK